MVVKNRGPDLYEHGPGIANRPGAERDDVSKGHGWMARYLDRGQRGFAPGALEAQVRHG